MAAMSSPQLQGAPHSESIDRLLARLPSLWQQGEARPTHKARVRPPRHWRTRKDPFEGVWCDVLLWLQKDPDTNAKDLLAKLREAYPGPAGLLGSNIAHGAAGADQPLHLQVQILVLGLPDRDPGIAVQRHPSAPLAGIPEVWLSTRGFATGFASHPFSYGEWGFTAMAVNRAVSSQDRRTPRPCGRPGGPATPCWRSTPAGEPRWGVPPMKTR